VAPPAVPVELSKVVIIYQTAVTSPPRFGPVPMYRYFKNPILFSSALVTACWRHTRAAVHAWRQLAVTSETKKYGSEVLQSTGG